MRIAIITFDGFNEIDAFVPLGLLNRLTALIEAQFDGMFCSIMVLDADGDIIGILSERDIVREVARHGPKCLDDAVASAMSRSR